MANCTSGCKNNNFETLLKYLKVSCSNVSETKKKKKKRDLYVNSCDVAQMKVTEGINLCE